MIIGIDIGTSYSCASIIDEEGKARPVELSTAVSMYGDKYSLPSAVFVEDGGKVLVGQAAMNNRIVKPENFFWEFKRVFGENTPIYLGDKELMPDDMYTEFFRHIKSRAEKTAGEAVDKAYITYPASFMETKKAKIISAAQRAGLFNVELVDEPTSAAMCCFAAEGIRENGTVLVYDFGGGTFDAALVKYENGSFTLPTRPLGLERCGGIDVDRAILNDMRGAVDQELLNGMSEKYALRFNGQLSEKAVQAKHQLTSSEIYQNSIFVGMDDFPYELRREKLEGMIAGLVGSTVALCRDILDNAGMKVDDLAGIIMVGGTSRIPLVRRTVEKFAGKVPIIHSLDPELAICQGAALYNGLAKKENAEELYEMGMRFYDAENYAEAVKCYRKAAEQGHAAAQNALGFCYRYGLGVEQNDTESVKWYKKSAEQGNANAQYNLGTCYLNGRGVDQNYSEAVKWYKEAANNGNEDARVKLEEINKKDPARGDMSAEDMFRLGEKYYSGDGAAQNYAEAVKCYRKAAAQGHADAQFYLGVCYDFGRGVAQNYAEAVKWYRKAAEQGNTAAQYNLGVCFDYGRGVAQNYAEAVKWYRKAAEQGTKYAQYNLGNCYRNGWGVDKNYAEAAKWFRKAAEQGDADAQNALGVCYEYGLGVEQNDTKAVKLYRKSAEQGHADAQCNLGVCYDIGQGVDQNYAEAVKWYRKAAEQGHAGAQYNLGFCYYYGRGVDQNYAEAVKWYRKAAEQGHDEAQYCLGKCYYFGYGVTQNYAEAVKWYRKAAEQDHPIAQEKLGDCYRDGHGVAQNHAEAVKWYAKAEE